MSIELPIEERRARVAESQRNFKLHKSALLKELGEPWFTRCEEALGIDPNQICMAYNAVLREALNRSDMKIRAMKAREENGRASRNDLTALGSKVLFILDNWQKLGAGEKRRLFTLDQLKARWEGSYEKVCLPDEDKCAWFGQCVTWSMFYKRADVEAVYSDLVGSLKS